MKRALITGIGGFVGNHLTNHLISKKIKIIGIIHPKHRLRHLDRLSKKSEIIKCNFLHKGSILNIVRKNKVDYIFHLAAFSSPLNSFENPKETLENNIIGQLNLLDSLSKIKSKAKILIIGSSDEYGNVDPKLLPVTELAPLAPLSPYAVSKVAQDLLGFHYFLHHDLNIVRVRPFNHVGPGQLPVFVVPAFASQIAKLEKKGGGQIKVGNINTYKDLTDVRDIAKAYLLALDKGKTGEVYNLGSGKVFKIADVLTKLLSLSKSKIEVIVDKKLFRESEITKIDCDYSKFKKQTGWKPTIPINKTLFDTIEYARNLLS